MFVIFSFTIQTKTNKIMPYIEKERVSEIRKQLRKEFPHLKMSITRRDSSVVTIAILEGPAYLAPEKGYEQVNHFYADEHYKNQPEKAETLQRIIDVANQGNRIESTDGDYGNIPSFYLHIRIGQWDKAYKTI